MSNKRFMATLVLAMLPLLAQAHDYVRTEYTTVAKPRQQCWNERVAASSHDYGGAIVGGLAGGIIGNQIGRGNGNTIATAAGAATGAVVGDRLSSDRRDYRTVQRCRTVYDQVQVPVQRVYQVRSEAPRFEHDRHCHDHHHGHGHDGHAWRHEWHKHCKKHH